MAVVKQSRISVSVGHLKPGWQVDHDIFADRVVLVTAGTVITERMIDAFHRRGIEQVDVSEYSSLAQYALSGHEEHSALSAMLKDPMAAYEHHQIEMAIPAEELEELAQELESFFEEIELGQNVDYKKVRGIVHDLVTMFSERLQYAVKLLDLDRFDRYTYRHSLNVGMLFMLVASDWVDSREELEELVFGTVLHDAGKARVGHEIINKPGKLTDEEWETMRMHPIWSAEVLADAGASDDAISIARSHHERVDGRGYPDKLPAMELSHYVRLSSICDVYDALTTKRSYKKKMDFAKAIDIILQGCGSQFDPRVAHEFIRRVGRYPVGSFVRLSSNEVAVVVRVNESAITRPVVSRVMRANGDFTPYAEELDLASQDSLYINEILVEAPPS